jgi:hypothetical protein
MTKFQFSPPPARTGNALPLSSCPSLAFPVSLFTHHRLITWSASATRQDEIQGHQLASTTDCLWTTFLCLFYYYVASISDVKCDDPKEDKV